MIAILEINNQIYDMDWFKWRSFRFEPVDTLEFEQDQVFEVGSSVSLKAKNSDDNEMQTLFQGKLQSSGYAVNAPNLFTKLPPKNWRNITAHGVIRDLYTQSKLGDPVIGIQDQKLPLSRSQKRLFELSIAFKPIAESRTPPKALMQVFTLILQVLFTLANSKTGNKKSRYSKQARI